jgi:hypothetical protein
MEQPAQPGVTTPLERILAIFAAAYCLIVTVSLWWGISAYEGMWPLPGLYFIEMAVLCLLGAWAFILAIPLGRSILWGVSGTLFAFSILGAFSVGFFYLPVALVFAVISLTSDIRNKGSILLHLGIFAITGIVQAALMLAAIRLLFP